MMLLLQAADISNALPVTDPGIKTTVDALADQAGLVAVSVWMIEFMKRSKLFPGINANSAQVTKWVSTGTALASALAVQVHIEGSAALGWTGTFAIPAAHVLWTSFIRFCGAKLGQDVLYNTVYNKPVEVVPVKREPMDPTGKPIEARD